MKKNVIKNTNNMQGSKGGIDGRVIEQIHQFAWRQLSNGFCTIKSVDNNPLKLSAERWQAL